MKYYRLLPAVLLAGGLLSFSLSRVPMPIGSTIPAADAQMKDISGKTISFNDVKQLNGLLVMFSCNTCPYVLMNQERTKEICAYALYKKIGVVLINSCADGKNSAESFAAMQRYALDQHYGWNYVIDQDSRMADVFGATGTPECYLFDNEDRLVYDGGIDNSPSDPAGVTRHNLRIAILEMLAGRPVSLAYSPTESCPIPQPGK